VTGVEDGEAGVRRAHDRRQHEQCVAEGADRFAGFVQIPRVVGIHENIAATLHLCINAGVGLDLERSGSGAADDRTVEALLTQLLDGAARGVHGVTNQCLPFRHGALVLRAALISLQAAKHQVLRRGDPLREFDRGGTGRNATARGADIDFDQYRHASSRVGRGTFNPRHLLRIVDTNSDLRDQ